MGKPCVFFWLGVLSKDNRVATRVVKVGGSLFDLPDLASRLSGWLGGQPPATTLLVAGGGPIAEQVRQLDSRHRLPPEAAHQMAVWAMRIHARVLLELLDSAGWLASIERVRGEAFGRAGACCAGEVGSGVCSWILDPVPFMERDERPLQPAPPLPCGWHVTSDSIAARVAQVVGAEELVLLKSRDATEGELEASDPLTIDPGADLVDPYFHKVAAMIPVVRSVNLRSSLFS